MNLLYVLFVLTFTFNACWSQQVPKPVSFVPPKGPNPDLTKLTYDQPYGQKPPVGVPPPPSPTSGATKPSYAGVVAQQPGKAAPAATVPTTATTKKPSLISDGELRQFSEELLAKDVNNVAKYVVIDLQAKLERNDTSDKSPKPLLTIKPEAYKPVTITKMKPLLDNYIDDTSKAEDVTKAEVAEEDAFLDAVIVTDVMQHAKKLLVSKGVVKADPKEFKDTLKKIWFGNYRRLKGGQVGSSGFEHVFLAEVTNGQVIGLHNWLYFAEQEKAKKVDYLGYLRNVNLGNKGSVLKIRFKYNNQPKAPSTLFVGTSPEFEMALYSVCFLLRANSQCPVKMNGTRFNIKTFSMTYQGYNYIGSAFPDVA